METETGVRGQLEAVKASSDAEIQSLRTQVVRLEEAEANFLAERDLMVESEQKMAQEREGLEREVSDCQAGFIFGHFFGGLL